MNKLIKNKEVFGGALFFIVSLYLFHEISNFAATAERYRSLGPEVFPYVLSGALCIFSVTLFIQGLLKDRSQILSFNLFSVDSARMFSIIAFLLVYLFLVEQIGFLTWALTFMALAQYILRERRFLVIAGISGAIVGVVYLIFVTLLRVPLPQGSIFS